jgi:hypothetical protein
MAFQCVFFAIRNTHVAKRENIGFSIVCGVGSQSHCVDFSLKIWHVQVWMHLRGLSFVTSRRGESGISLEFNFSERILQFVGFR